MIGKIAVRALSRSSRLILLPMRLCATKKAFDGPVSTKPGIQHSFKAETKKLLDIVAKSLYTDKEVFIRELLSNASDAIQKRRFEAMKQGLDEGQYEILVTTNEGKRQLIIQDNGIGMSQEEMIQNLGTIAKSGSKEFVQKVRSESTAPDSIIGQFGVGFYSSFIVGHNIEVVSRKSKDDPAFCWSSDGSGQFSICQVTECEFERGTKIIIHLRPESESFSKTSQVKEIINKYSNFINSGIYLDGTKVNLIKAIWTREKREITDQEYKSFHKELVGSEEYQTHLHFSTDVPISIKSVFYFPTRNKEQHGSSLQTQTQVHLYSRKIVIKRNCKEILPEFMRFMVGVVDCEDLPLNISRENYQDSSLMLTLKDVLTKRIIRHLKEYSENEREAYNNWFKEFEVYIKEGMVSSNYKDELAELVRYADAVSGNIISLDDYIKQMKEGQKSIYYMASQGNTQSSALCQPYKNSGIPVLIGRPFEQMIFMQLGNYKGYRFTNIETNNQDMSKIFKKNDSSQGIPKEQFEEFATWIKGQLNPAVSLVTACDKPIEGPAYIMSPISSAMRSMTKIKNIMEKREGENTLEKVTHLKMQINTGNDIMKELNELRKTDKEKASIVLKVVMDSCLVKAGIMHDIDGSYSRVNELIKLALKK